MNVLGSEHLFSAIKSGDLDAVKAAVAAGADVNNSRADIYPLLFAVREKHLAIAEFLIEKNASIEAPNNFGWNALLEATRSGQMDMVHLMDEYELDLRVTSHHGDGLIHAAVQGNTTGMVQFFFDRDVNVDRPNRNGVTPVMLAAERRTEDSFRDLVRLGADLDRKDGAGVSARDRVGDWMEGQAILTNEAVDPIAQAKTTRRKTPLAAAQSQVTSVAEAPTVAEPATPAPARPGLSRIIKRSSTTR